MGLQIIFSTFCLSLFSEFSSININSDFKKKVSLKTTEVTYFKKKTQAEVHRFPSTGLAVHLTSWGICLHTVWGWESQSLKLGLWAYLRPARVLHKLPINVWLPEWTQGTKSHWGKFGYGKLYEYIWIEALTWNALSGYHLYCCLYYMYSLSLETLVLWMDNLFHFYVILWFILWYWSIFSWRSVLVLSPFYGKSN